MPSPSPHSPAIVDQTSLMPNVSATVAPHAASISRRTAARPAPGSPAVTRWRTPSARGSSPASRARAARWAGKLSVPKTASIPSAGMSSSRRRDCPTPTGTTVAPVSSSAMWSAMPPAYSA